VFVLGVDTSVVATGWAFAPGEAVTVTLTASIPADKTTGIGSVLEGGNANSLGVVEITLGSVPGSVIEAGRGYVVAEGSTGTKASALITFVEEVK
jgi:hypothetical protein